MFSMIIVLIIILVLLGSSVTLNIFMIKRIFAFNDQREKLIVQIERSLDILDQIYKRFYDIELIPMASDDPVVKQVVNNIKDAKNAILAIANYVVSYEIEEDEEEDSE